MSKVIKSEVTNNPDGNLSIALTTLEGAKETDSQQVPGWARETVLLEPNSLYSTLEEFDCGSTVTPVKYVRSDIHEAALAELANIKAWSCESCGACFPSLKMDDEERENIKFCTSCVTVQAMEDELATLREEKVAIGQVIPSESLNRQTTLADLTCTAREVLLSYAGRSDSPRRQDIARSVGIPSYKKSRAELIDAGLMFEYRNDFETIFGITPAGYELLRLTPAPPTDEKESGNVEVTHEKIERVVVAARSRPDVLGINHYEAGPYAGQWRFVTEADRPGFRHMDEGVSSNILADKEFRSAIRRALQSGATFDELGEWES